MGRKSQKPEQLTMDVSHLEAKNLELAKALAEIKHLYNQAICERDHFERELFMASLRITKLENYMKSIGAAARENITSALNISNHTADILRYVSSSKCILQKDSMNESNSSSFRRDRSSVDNKLQVVKPMISGHVILRPTINLRRVNEFSPEEIRSLQNRSSNQRLSNGESPGQSTSQNDSCQRLSNRNRQFSNTQFVDETEGNEDNNDELDRSTNSSDTHMDLNNHLNVIEEERDSELEQHTLSPIRRGSTSSSSSGGDATSIPLPTTSNQIPLLSGVFKDVRVYLSPVDPHNNVSVIRGSGKPHFKRSSEATSTMLSGNLPHSVNAIEQEELEESVRASNALRSHTFHQNEMTYNEILHNITNNFDADHTDNGLNVKNKWTGNRKQRSEYIRSSKKHNLIRHTNSTNGRSLENDDYDPLEGPSNLLDNNEPQKLEALRGLGLTPVSSIPMSPTVSSPASAVLKRRTQLKTDSDVGSTPKKHSKLYINTRKINIKKEPTVPNLDDSSGEVEMRLTLNPTQPKRRTRKHLQEVTKSSPSISFKHTPMRSPLKKSPIKEGRSKRKNKNISLKEPSLRKKLRRSK